MKTLYVVTHPQSIHHVEDRVGGWYDTGLTDLGQRQAGAIAARIAELCAGKATSLVSSDLLRCSETAEIIGRSLGLKPCLTPGLREMSYGVAEGKPQAWLDSRRLPVPDEGSLDDTGGIDGAETRREMGTRIYDAMDALQADPPDTLVMSPTALRSPSSSPGGSACRSTASVGSVSPSPPAASPISLKTPSGKAAPW